MIIAVYMSLKKRAKIRKQKIGKIDMCHFLRFYGFES